MLKDLLCERYLQLFITKCLLVQKIQRFIYKIKIVVFIIPTDDAVFAAATNNARFVYAYSFFVRVTPVIVSLFVCTTYIHHTRFNAVQKGEQQSRFQGCWWSGVAALLPVFCGTIESAATRRRVRSYHTRNRLEE